MHVHGELMHVSSRLEVGYRRQREPGLSNDRHALSDFDDHRYIEDWSVEYLRNCSKAHSWCVRIRPVTSWRFFQIVTMWMDVMHVTRAVTVLNIRCGLCVESLSVGIAELISHSEAVRSNVM